jgi:hypothetical protein
LIPARRERVITDRTAAPDPHPAADLVARLLAHPLYGGLARRLCGVDPRRHDEARAAAREALEAWLPAVECAV